MSKYLEYFDGAFDSTVVDKMKPENYPYVAYSVAENRIVYGEMPLIVEEPEIDLTTPYVTFTAEEDNSSIGVPWTSPGQTLEYSTDTATWNSMDPFNSISLPNTGDKVYVRGILSSDNDGHYTQFKMSGKIAASGNCNAIWDYQDLNAPLKIGCGQYMFDGCTSLTTAPELPATELTEKCYQCMFRGCTSLTTAPELPATTLANSCYYDMFDGCTSLTTAPEILPATTLADSCYGGMFSGCTSLTTAPEILPATTLANSCYSYMFGNCQSLTTAPELPATTLADYCYHRMFSGCTSLTTAPELPATELASKCYYYMFYRCKPLNYIKCLATDTLASKCTSSWLSGVSSTGTFVKHPNMTSWDTSTSGIPSGWEVVDAEL